MEHLDLFLTNVISVAPIWRQLFHLGNQSLELRFGHHWQLGVGQLHDRLLDGGPACSK